MTPTAFDEPLRIASGLHPALRDFADECRAVAVRVMAYVSGLAVLAIIAADLFAAAPVALHAAAPGIAVAAPGWTEASRPHPAFAVSKLDLADKTEAYSILRHPEGGRRDILTWSAAAGGAPLAGLEIYRPGGEIEAFADPAAELAARMAGAQNAEAEPAGVIDTKFGPVALLRPSGAAADRRACLGFARSFESPAIRISGWTCQAQPAAAQRAFLGCTLNRLTLLSAGNDPKLAELFARAELKRDTCSMTQTPAAGWLASADAPPLRGRLRAE
jgi:hypothetical protein